MSVVVGVIVISVMALRPVKIKCYSQVQGYKISCGRLLGLPKVVEDNLKELVLVSETQEEILVGDATVTVEEYDGGGIRLNIHVPESMMVDKALNDKLSLGVFNIVDSYINKAADLEIAKSRVKKNIKDWSGKSFVFLSK